jgi:hypothetical protein
MTKGRQAGDRETSRWIRKLTFFPSAASEGGGAEPARRALRRDAVLSGAADCCCNFERGAMISKRDMFLTERVE